MHNTLRVEQYAGAAELPHGVPAVAQRSAVVAVSLAHRVAGARRGRPAAVLPHRIRRNGDARPRTDAGLRRGARPLAGVRRAHRRDESPDRAVGRADHAVGRRHRGRSRHPEVDSARRRSSSNWHYGAEASFERYIQTIARGGFQQMVAPGASNWNEIFPERRHARWPTSGASSTRERPRTFSVSFQTVWHDDGETLYEATWYPVIYAAAAAWQARRRRAGRSSRPTFLARSSASTISTLRASVRELGDALRAVRARRVCVATRRPTRSFGAIRSIRRSPPRCRRRTRAPRRLAAESVEQSLYFAAPPLHANAAFVMFLAARRYDALGRKVQIGRARCARCTPTRSRTPRRIRDATERDLLWCRYWMWELRDAYEELAPLYARAWRYESRDGHLAEQPRALSSCRAKSDRPGRRVLSRERAVRAHEDAPAARARVVSP